MPLTLILAAIGLGVGGLSLAGIIHLPHGMAIAAIAFGLLLVILAIKALTKIIKIIAGAGVLILAAMAIFGPHVFRHLFH